MARSSASPPPPSRRVSTCTCKTARWAISPRITRTASTRRTPTYFDPPATFQGIRRPDGKVATRNYIGILTSVNCSAHVAGLVANMFQRNPFTGDDPLADYPNVDGVVALTHKTGCGMTQDEPLRVLRRTLAGYARHPNFSHVIVLGLGCEVNQIGGLMQEQRLAGRLRSLDIQTVGGTPENRRRRRGFRARGAGGIQHRARVRQCRSAP